MQHLGSTVHAVRRSRHYGVLSSLAVVTALLTGLALTPGTPATAATTEPTQQAHGTAPFRTFRLPNPTGRTLYPNAPNLAHAGARGAPLLVFLPATGAVPQNYRRILTVAVRLGYSVLGLDYWNLGTSVTRTCRSAAECYTRLQRNRFTGRGPGHFSRVNAANSIQHRLLLALRTLHARDPTGEWSRYFQRDTIRWHRIVLAGHSQGGGESAFISHTHRVRGVLMFSSPVETYDDVVASWMEHPGRTPARRMYALDSANDMYAHRIVRSWPHLGLNRLGKIHTARTPIGSHRLITTLPLGTPHQAHDRTATDASPVTRTGTPRLQRTWRWMFTQTR